MKYFLLLGCLTAMAVMTIAFCDLNKTNAKLQKDIVYLAMRNTHEIYMTNWIAITTNYDAGKLTESERQDAYQIGCIAGAVQMNNAILDKDKITFGEVEKRAMASITNAEAQLHIRY